VARSLETALHKLHELKFDLGKVVSGAGFAAVTTRSEDEIQAIGWTNDAILYGGVVDVWVRAEDAELVEIGPKVPSCSSPAPWLTVRGTVRAGEPRFFIDAKLFSPAVVRLMNLNSGRRHVSGRLEPEDAAAVVWRMRRAGRVNARVVAWNNYPGC
jgi:methenyltetrahydromethanopterin cyclohydrolase